MDYRANEPWYVRKARLAQQRNPQKHPVQLEIGEPMAPVANENVMTLEQKMTLKAILEGDYSIYWIEFEFVADTNYLRVEIDNVVGRRRVRIMPDGKITQTQQVEVQL